MRPRSISLILSMALLALPHLGFCDDLPLVTCVGLGFGKCLNDYAPSGSVAAGIGIMHELQGRSIGIGFDLGYVGLGTDTRTYRAPSGRTKRQDERWFSTPMTGQIYLFLPTAERARFYLDGGAGFYEVHRANLKEQTPPGELPDLDTQGALGVNGGIGWVSDRPDRPWFFGFDLKLHAVATNKQSTEFVTLLARIYFR